MSADNIRHRRHDDFLGREPRPGGDRPGNERPAAVTRLRCRYGGPAARGDRDPCAVTNGFAESDGIAADGVKRWVAVNAITVANRSAVRWLVRQAISDRWSVISSNDLSGLDPTKPVQIRLELDANAAGTTPWVGPASVRFEGTPRAVSLPSNVYFVGTQENGLQWTAFLGVAMCVMNRSESCGHLAVRGRAFGAPLCSRDLTGTSSRSRFIESA